MYQHLFHFLNLLMFQNLINLIQLLLFLVKILVLENIHSFILCLFINPTVKRTIIAFPFNIQFIAFSLYYFFNFKLFLIRFFQFFFLKRCNNFFVFKIIDNICPRHNIFTYFDHKNFFIPIWNIAYCKIFFIFSYSNIISLSLYSLLESIYMLDFISKGFFLLVL